MKGFRITYTDPGGNKRTKQVRKHRQSNRTDKLEEVDEIQYNCVNLEFKILWSGKQNCVSNNAYGW